MSFIPRVTCRRCGRQYSGLRGRCPYCGTRRVKQSDRVPATSASTDPGSAAGERAASNSRWQLIFGGILLLAVILAVVVLVSISLNSSAQPNTTPTAPIATNTAPVSTPTPSPVPTPTPTVESVTIYYNNAPASDEGYTMNPQWNLEGNTLTISVSVFPNTLTDLANNIIWSSSDESVITCASDPSNPTVCTLTQVGNGNCTITCTVFGVSDTLPMIGSGM